MIKAFRIFARSVTLWWNDFLTLTFINLVWFLFQLTIIAGPAATVALYNVVRQVADEEIVEPGYAWQQFRQMFWKSWKWGGLNLLLAIVMASNFLLYQGQTGPLVPLLRGAWGMITVIWLTANLFFWPFWLAQEDKSLWTTYRNCFVMFVKHPALTISLGLFMVVLIVVSLLATLPLTTTLAVWLALMGTLAVDDELKSAQKTPPGPRPR